MAWFESRTAFTQEMYIRGLKSIYQNLQKKNVDNFQISETPKKSLKSGKHNSYPALTM